MKLTNTCVIGADTREWIVSPATCPALERHGIVLAGLSEARTPYRMARPELTIAEVQVCHGGYGLMLDGETWQRLVPGRACLSPVGVPQAFHATRGVTWGFAWVQYEPGRILTRSAAIEIVPADPVALRSAIGALHHEVMTCAEPAALAMLAEWVDREVARITRGRTGDERLQRLFHEVDATLGQAWTTSELARRAGMSGEHLRRLCHLEYQQSPLERVRALRMTRAAALLRRSAEKVETIAFELGYSSLYAFSSAFKRAYGKSPSRYR